MSGSPSAVRVCRSPRRLGVNSMVWMTRGNFMKVCPKPRNLRPAWSHVLLSSVIVMALKSSPYSTVCSVAKESANRITAGATTKARQESASDAVVDTMRLSRAHTHTIRGWGLASGQKEFTARAPVFVRLPSLLEMLLYWHQAPTQVFSKTFFYPKKVLLHKKILWKRLRVLFSTPCA